MTQRRRTRSPLAALAALAISSPALGAGVSSTLEVRPGTLSLTRVADDMRFTSAPMVSGGWREVTRRITVTVSDRRGSGAGWVLTFGAGVRTATGRRILGARIAVWRVGIACARTCTRPRGNGELPVRISERSPARIVVAHSPRGMGTVRLRIDVRLTLPAGAPAGPYVLQPRFARAIGP